MAYESQLRSDRAKLHQRLAAKIEARGTADESAALIAEHLEAAGDLHAAFAWHMRAGGWSNFRDIAAAQTSWRRARQVADRLPQHDPKRTSMRIAPRTFLCGPPGEQAVVALTPDSTSCVTCARRRVNYDHWRSAWRGE